MMTWEGHVIEKLKTRRDYLRYLVNAKRWKEARMNTPDPQPTEPGTEPEPVTEPDDGSTEAEEDEGEVA